MWLLYANEMILSAWYRRQGNSLGKECPLLASGGEIFLAAWGHSEAPVGGRWSAGWLQRWGFCWVVRMKCESSSTVGLWLACNLSCHTNKWVIFWASKIFSILLIITSQSFISQTCENIMCWIGDYNSNFAFHAMSHTMVFHFIQRN